MTNVLAVTKYEETVNTKWDEPYELHTSHCQELLKQYVIYCIIKQEFSIFITRIIFIFIKII